MIFGVFALKGIGGYGENVLLNTIGQKAVIDIQMDLFKKLLSTDFSFFTANASGHLVSHFTTHITLLRSALTHTVVGIGRDFFTLIFLIALMFYRDFFLAGCTFIVFPTMLLPIILLGRRMRKLFYENQEDLSLMSARFVQIFQNIRIVKAFNTQDYEYNQAKRSLYAFLKTFKKSSHVRSLSHPFIELIGAIGIIGVIVYGGFQVMAHQKTPGDFMSFIGAMIFAYEPLKRLSNLNATLQEGISAGARIFELMDTKSHVDSDEGDIEIARVKGRIEFKDVSFSYPKHPVLSHVSFTIEPGQKIAFVGASGCGKSTILNLICRFFDPLEGAILLDNHNIKTFRTQNLRSHIALVSQEIGLFDRSIFKNIAYGLDHVSKDDVIMAAKRAGAHEFIEKLPHQYDAKVGENGICLSGGQRQRIAIARAFLKNAPILLLDEATSALDNESERLIQHSLDTLMEGRTTIMVAHRLSTIAACDCIYVLHEGKIAEHGTHKHLLQKELYYHRMWTKQII